MQQLHALQETTDILSCVGNVFVVACAVLRDKPHCTCPDLFHLLARLCDRTCDSCRIGHDYQWTNSKAASISGADLDSVSASWKCAVSFDVYDAPKALHLGVYAVQATPPSAVVESSSSFLSVVSTYRLYACTTENVE